MHNFSPNFSAIKTPHSVSHVNQSAQLIHRWLHLWELVIIFTAPKAFQACPQSNEWSHSKSNRLGHPAENFGLALMQRLTHIHTFTFIAWGCEKYTLSLSHILTHTHTHTQTYMAAILPRDLWLEPAALTQQHINHWALSSTAGPHCHAELDSTGIKVCN